MGSPKTKNRIYPRKNFTYSKSYQGILFGAVSRRNRYNHRKWRFYLGEIMRNSIAKSITSTVKDLNESGLVDDITMKNIENLCLPEVQEYSPKKIVSIRKKFRLSQAALASIFNISPSTVQKWEQGNKKPTGASRKLLDIIERKGIEALI